MPGARAESESTFDYFAATRSYLEQHGKPVAFYSDRLSVFYVSKRDQAAGGKGLSQFGRAMTDLNIEIICANSPQAKGRVEPPDRVCERWPRRCSLERCGARYDKIIAGAAPAPHRAGRVL